MRPNHFLTRLRQDIRKMGTAPSLEMYTRFRRFAISKIAILGARYKAGLMSKADESAFNLCLNSFMVAANEHQEYEREAKGKP